MSCLLRKQFLKRTREMDCHGHLDKENEKDLVSRAYGMVNDEPAKSERHQQQGEEGGGVSDSSLSSLLVPQLVDDDDVEKNKGNKSNKSNSSNSIMTNKKQRKVRFADCDMDEKDQSGQPSLGQPQPQSQPKVEIIRTSICKHFDGGIKSLEGLREDIWYTRSDYRSFWKDRIDTVRLWRSRHSHKIHHHQQQQEQQQHQHVVVDDHVQNCGNNNVAEYQDTDDEHSYTYTIRGLEEYLHDTDAAEFANRRNQYMAYILQGHSTQDPRVEALRSSALERARALAQQDAKEAKDCCCCCSYLNRHQNDHQNDQNHQIHHRTDSPSSRKALPQQHQQQQQQQQQQQAVVNYAPHEMVVRLSPPRSPNSVLVDWNKVSSSGCYCDINKTASAIETATGIYCNDDDDNNNNKKNKNQTEESFVVADGICTPSMHHNRHHAMAKTTAVSNKSIFHWRQQQQKVVSEMNQRLIQHMQQQQQQQHQQQKEKDEQHQRHEQHHHRGTKRRSSSMHITMDNDNGASPVDQHGQQQPQQQQPQQLQQCRRYSSSSTFTSMSPQKMARRSSVLGDAVQQRRMSSMLQQHLPSSSSSQDAASSSTSAACTPTSSIPMTRNNNNNIQEDFERHMRFCNELLSVCTNGSVGEVSLGRRDSLALAASYQQKHCPPQRHRAHGVRMMPHHQQRESLNGNGMMMQSHHHRHNHKHHHHRDSMNVAPTVATMLPSLSTHHHLHLRRDSLYGNHYQHLMQLNDGRRDSVFGDQYYSHCYPQNHQQPSSSLNDGTMNRTRFFLCDDSNNRSYSHVRRDSLAGHYM